MVHSKNSAKCNKRHKPNHDENQQSTLRHGNFHGYYKYRLRNTEQRNGEVKDPRMSIIQKGWMDGKKCLDIGCNTGDLTISLAKTFSPAYIIGIDLDSDLISLARSHLRKSIISGEVNHTSSKKKPSESESKTQVPLSFRLWKIPDEDVTSDTNNFTPKGLKFPFNVVFKRENIVSESHEGKDYDVIVCFSVTKWIHLYHGDEGLKQVFHKLYKLLLPGGKLLLEPQPWRSYHRRKHTSTETYQNFKNISFRPKDFESYLIDTVGFRSCQLLHMKMLKDSDFKRPVYLYVK